MHISLQYGACDVFCFIIHWNIVYVCIYSYIHTISQLAALLTQIYYGDRLEQNWPITIYRFETAEYNNYHSHE